MGTKTLCIILKIYITSISKETESSKRANYLNYNVEEITRKQLYWKRDPLAIKILSREMLQQKLQYCHNNHLQEHWNLAKEPESYYWSSAYDYSNNFSRFTFIKQYFDKV